MEQRPVAPPPVPGGSTGCDSAGGARDAEVRPEGGASPSVGGTQAGPPAAAAPTRSAADGSDADEGDGGALEVTAGSGSGDDGSERAVGTVAAAALAHLASSRAIGHVPATPPHDGSDGSDGGTISAARRWSNVRTQVKKFVRARLAVNAVEEMRDRAEMSKVFGMSARDLLLQVAKDESALPPYMIHPKAYWRKVWDVAAMGFVLIVLAYTPFELGFNYVATLNGTGSQAFWWVADMVMATFFAIDIVLNFRTAIFVDDELVHDPKVVARHYMRAWFWIDLLSTIPCVAVFDAVDDIAESLNTGKGARALRFLRFFRLIRLTRMLRLFRVQRYLQELGEAGQVAQTVLRFCTLLFWLVQCGHVLACTWYFLADIRDLGPDTWAWTFRLDDPDETFTHKYVISVYWAFVTITTVGYGDIVPANDTERIFVIFCVFIGNGAAALIIGKATALAAAAGAASQVYSERMQSVSEFMRRRGLPSALRGSIREYYDVIFSRGVCYDERTILDELSFNLRRRVLRWLNRDVIKSVPLFQGASEYLVDAVIQHLEPVWAMAQDNITRQGEFGHHLFLLRHGIVAVEVNGETLHHLKDGSFFGEVCIVFPNLRRTTTVRAITVCELAALSREAIVEVMAHYPELEQAMQQVARSHLEMDAHLRTIEQETLREESGGKPPTTPAKGRGSGDAEDAKEMAEGGKERRGSGSAPIDSLVLDAGDFGGSFVDVDDRGMLVTLPAVSALELSAFASRDHGSDGSSGDEGEHMPMTPPLAAANTSGRVRAASRASGWQSRLKSETLRRADHLAEKRRSAAKLAVPAAATAVGLAERAKRRLARGESLRDSSLDAGMHVVERERSADAFEVTSAVPRQASSIELATLAAPAAAARARQSPILESPAGSVGSHRVTGEGHHPPQASEVLEAVQALRTAMEARFSALEARVEAVAATAAARE